MRIKLTFHAEKNIVIPVQYNYLVQAMIYNNISKELSDFLHDHGFIINGRQFKLFTFSRLQGRFTIRDKMIEFVPPISLVVASPVERFLRELAEGMLRNDNLTIYGQRVMLTSVAVFPGFEDVDFSEEVTIKMLSPVVAYNTVKKGNSSRTVYFSPWDEWFSELVRINLERKYQLIYGQKLEGSDIRIEPLGPKDDRYCKVLQYKDTVIKGWNGIYRLRGDRRLIKVAYEAGLGSKNSQGFGCFEVIKGLRK
ncbi:CRISPR-associated endoribonuclease Cas6 [Caldicoprobacter algeriensis]|uniref:CRISPR-associated endoribonuclease Cas6 n=1 Tax=Caldicoprobacter algeriensis TaxID=699281 RepID=UPI00207A8605|nr:CRISPR-associated endoribonuclease Cas6 [Caldicoprobacter algeriensis]MCM8901269.1 CRISPR-associated endoribonuclease Cas6 [Caldicoprobacter algeriensis]